MVAAHMTLQFISRVFRAMFLRCRRLAAIVDTAVCVVDGGDVAGVLGVAAMGGVAG